MSVSVSVRGEMSGVHVRWSGSGSGRVSESVRGCVPGVRVRWSVSVRGRSVSVRGDVSGVRVPVLAFDSTSPPFSAAGIDFACDVE